MSLPCSVKYAVVGAGVHGLSTAYHLAQLLKQRGRGPGEDIVVVDKGTIGAGASGIACGVVRNNYFQPAMRELMAHSVEVWESDAETFSYHPVGYLQLSPECMREDVASIYEQQCAIARTDRHRARSMACARRRRCRAAASRQARGRATWPRHGSRSNRRQGGVARERPTRPIRLPKAALSIYIDARSSRATPRRRPSL